MLNSKVAADWIKNFGRSGLLKRLLLEAKKNTIIKENYSEFLYPGSIEKADQIIFAMARVGGSNEALFIASPTKNGDIQTNRFKGYETKENGFIIKLCELSFENAFSLQNHLNHTEPSFLPVDSITIGLGDRLGIATTGHIRSFIGKNAVPVFAQQSVRELKFTGRSFRDVMSDVIWAVFRAGFKHPWGADGDHLKSEEWIKEAVEAGFRMITADVSDFIDDEYYSKTDSSVLTDYELLDDEYRGRIEKHFLKREFTVGDNTEGSGKIRFNRAQLARCALVYGRAIERAVSLYRYVVKLSGGDRVNFELSVDEVSIPTTPHDHIFISELLDIHSVKLFSIAPKFSGSFQKAIDYEGKLTDFERDLMIHHSIALKRGYKISVHSGSDKFRIFPIIARICGRRFHLKTSGTSWLEALRVIAKAEPLFFRKIYRISLERYESARKFYHVKADRSNAPEPASLKDDELESLLNNSVTRQILHIAYGEILKDRDVKDKFFSLMMTYKQLYWEYLENHIKNHLEALGVI